MKSKIIALSKNEDFKSLLKQKKVSNKYVTIFFGKLGNKNKFKLKTIYEVNDLLAYRFVFFNKLDLLKFYQHLFNEKSLVIVNNYINDNNINYNNSMLFRYQNDHKECPIFQIECQMFTINDYYKFIYNENKNLLYFKNINFPYRD